MSTLLADEKASTHRFPLSLLLPAIGALLYPYLLAALSFVLTKEHVAIPPRPSVIAFSALAVLACVLLVLGIASARAMELGRSEPANAPGRWLAHLSFTTPSLLTGFGNVMGLLRAGRETLYAWTAFWLVVMLVATLARDPARGVTEAALPRRSLATAHGFSALLILLLFILPHLGNHLTGIVSGAAHIAVMKVVRLDYRGRLVEPVLLALICFQIVSGFVLARHKLDRPSDFFGTLQSLTGIYVGIYLLGHMIAAFAARGEGTDTNWNWLTDNDHGLLFHLGSFSLVGHYWVGPIAIIAHLACGLRVVMTAHGFSKTIASRLAMLVVALGVIASSTILAGLLGVHLA